MEPRLFVLVILLRKKKRVALHYHTGEFFRPPGGQVSGAGHDPLRVRAVPGERGVKDGLRQGCLGAGTVGSGRHEGDI